jgi:hypothetical protein
VGVTGCKQVSTHTALGAPVDGTQKYMRSECITSFFQASRAQREKLVGYWERLFCHVMQTKSHGRRWKFRIEPLRRKLENGFNPYLSDSDSDEEDENESVDGSEVKHVKRHVCLVICGWVCNSE